ncbi:hypothetical protein [Streptomyces sp. enrichment culture]|uniref:hypothetical protein n=1 Tax=Streptomyces sp. enrichment culture TaxID=1795815 RepID=UPI003F557995
MAGWTLPPIGNANTYRRELAAGRLAAPARQQPRTGQRQVLPEVLGAGQDTPADHGRGHSVRGPGVEQLGTGWNPDADCGTAIELAGLAPDDARWALTCLETLQVLDRDDTRLRVEPVLHAALGTVDTEK